MKPKVYILSLLVGGLTRKLYFTVYTSYTNSTLVRIQVLAKPEVFKFEDIASCDTYNNATFTARTDRKCH